MLLPKPPGPSGRQPPGAKAASARSRRTARGSFVSVAKRREAGVRAPPEPTTSKWARGRGRSGALPSTRRVRLPPASPRRRVVPQSAARARGDDRRPETPDPEVGSALPEVCKTATAEEMRWERALARAARGIFDAKCADLKKTLTEDARARWVTHLLQQCQRGEFVVVDAGLTPGACARVCDYVLANNLSGDEHPFTALEIAGNPVGDDGARHVARLLGGADGHLKRLDAASTGMGQAGFASVLRALVGNKTLATLSLASTGTRGTMRCGYEGCDAAAALLLSEGSALRRLRLRNCGVGLSWRGVERLAEGLAGARSLLSLDLGKNGLGRAALRRLLQALRENAVLETLSLRGNPAGSLAATEIAEFLGGADVGSRSRLSSLDLGFCGLSVSAFALLTHALGHNRHLRRLTLDGNPLGGVPGHALLFAEAQRSRAGDRITEECIADFEELLRERSVDDAVVSPVLGLNRGLEALSLARCGVGDRLARDLAAVLSGGSVAQLVLARNAITDDGAAEIAVWAGADGSALVELDLSFNRVGEHGGALLAAAARRAPSLTRLDVEHNELGPRAGAALHNAAMHNGSLTALACRHNGMPFDLVKKIRAATADNRSALEQFGQEATQHEVEQLRAAEERLRVTKEQVHSSAEHDVRLETRLASLGSDVARAQEQEDAALREAKSRLAAARADRERTERTLRDWDGEAAAEERRLAAEEEATRARVARETALQKRLQQDLADARIAAENDRRNEQFGLDEIGRLRAILRSQGRRAAEARDEAALERQRLESLLRALELAGLATGGADTADGVLARPPLDELTVSPLEQRQ